MNKIKVLLVEDEASLALIIQQTLATQGFEVVTAYDGEEGLRIMPTVCPDVLVADVMMPRMDGFEMVKRLRKSGCTTPVLFLTARSAIKDVVEGFELGGDDYLKKPFSMLELIVRVRALAQRASASRPQSVSSGETVFQIGQYTLNTVNQTLSHFGLAEELSNRESELLRMLATEKYQVVSTHDILMQLWGDDSLYNGRSLQVFITKLRHKLEKDPTIKITNVRGIGYKLIVS